MPIVTMFVSFVLEVLSLVQRLFSGLMLSVVCLAVLGSCLAGCTINLQGSGKAGISQATEWVVFHETEQEESQTESTAALEAPAVIEWLVGDDDGETQAGEE